MELREGDLLNLDDIIREVIDPPERASCQICRYETDTEGLFTEDKAGVYIHENLLPLPPTPDFDVDSVLKIPERFQSLDLQFLAYPRFRIHILASAIFFGDLEGVPGLNPGEWVNTVATPSGARGNVESIVDRFLELGVPQLEILGESVTRKILRTDV